MAKQKPVSTPSSEELRKKFPNPKVSTDIDFGEESVRKPEPEADKIDRLLKAGYTVMVVRPHATRFTQKYRVVRTNDRGRDKLIIVNELGEVVGAQG